MPYSGPIYVDDVMPILERMKLSKIFYSGVIPKIDLLEQDIRGLRTSATSKVPSQGPVSEAVAEILTVLDRVRWITSRYRRGLLSRSWARNFYKSGPYSSSYTIWSYRPRRTVRTRAFK